MRPQDKSSDYLILVLAHTRFGRLHQLTVPASSLIILAAFLLLGLVLATAVTVSYGRMLLKYQGVQELEQELAGVKQRYEALRDQFRRQGEQLQELQVLASEVSISYGLYDLRMEAGYQAADTELLPSYDETVAEYNFLRTATFSKFSRAYGLRWMQDERPSLWPVEGRLVSSFGSRIDPFTHVGAFHTGVDISAPQGTPVRASADGIVIFAGQAGGYGLMVILEHGNGLTTRYAHLSRIDVIPGQQIQRGEVLGAVGQTGRATAPNLHYEVRLHGVPLNPYKFLRGAARVGTDRQDVSLF